MPDIKKVLRDLADAYEREEEGEHTKQLADEIEELKAKVDDASKAQVTDALADITDEERELIRKHRAGIVTPPAPAAPVAPPAPAPAVKRTRPGRKSGMAYEWYVDDAGSVVKTDIANIYNGPDEDDEVPLPGEEAA